MAVAELERYRHDDPPFTVDLPAGAELGVMPGLLIVARAPEAATVSPFRPNITILAQELPAGTDLDALADAAIDEAARCLPAWHLLDREAGEGADERTLATYLARLEGVDLGREVPVVVEQWRRVHDGLLWVLSASCELAEYGELADLWDACARSLAPGAGGDEA